MKIQDVARMCHQANREYCKLIGDPIAPHWDFADQDRMIQGVSFVLNNPTATPKEVHQEWVKTMRECGWLWGPEKDIAKKTHPAIGPFDAQPPAQRVKDRMFIALVNLMAPFLGYGTRDRGGCEGSSQQVGRTLTQQLSLNADLRAEIANLRLENGRLKAENNRIEKIAEGRMNQLSNERLACAECYQRAEKKQANLRAVLKDAEAEIEDTSETLVKTTVELQKAEEALKRFEPGENTLVQWQFGRKADLKYREAFEKHIDELVEKNNKGRVEKSAQIFDILGDQEMRAAAKDLANYVQAELTNSIRRGSNPLYRSLLP